MSDVPEKIRQEVYERDFYRCKMCGVTNAYGYHIHHIIYRSTGGLHVPENLITLCSKCHTLVHTNKNLYQPLLSELLLTDKPVTGLQLLRWRKSSGD